MTAERPLRVLSVSAQYYPDLGGVETHVHEVARRLGTRSDIELTVLATDRSGRLPRTERGESFDIVRRRSWPRTRDYYLAPGLAGVIARGRWDLVHVQGIHTLVPVVAMTSARLARIPYVVTFHTGGHSSAARTGLRSQQWRLLTPLLRGAGALVGVSRFERRMFEDVTGIAPERFRVIRNGGALPAVPADVDPVPGRIVSSGRLERYKGHHRVIEALPLVRAVRPEAHLVVLGAGPYEAELRALAAGLGVADAVHIRFVPPGDRSAMATELAQAAVVAALSDYEAHPVAVMEALALGVPVVGFDVAGIADLVEDGLVTGLAPDASPAQCAQVLLAGMREDRAAPAAALDLPTWEDAAGQLAQLYRQVASAGPRARPAADRPRVVHVTTTLTTGGAERQVKFLAQDDEVDARVVCLYQRGLVGDELVADGTPVTVLGMAGLGRLSAVVRLRAELRRSRPDVVHVHMLSAMLWGIPAARLAGVPVVVATEHSLMEDTIEGRRKTPPLRLLYLLLTSWCTRCVAVSRITQDRMQAWGVPAERITVIENGIDFEGLRYSAADRASARDELGVDPDAGVVLGVGRLDPVKRFEVLVDAMEPVLRDQDLLVLLGEGPSRAALQARDPAQAVRFLGARSDVARWLSAADVLVSTSRDETFGMAVVEALGSGLPVVYEQCPAVDALTGTPPAAYGLPEDLGAQEELTALGAAVRAALGRERTGEVDPELQRRYGLEALRRQTRELYAGLLTATRRRGR